MRLLLEFNSEKEFVVPIDYNQQIQGLLYRSISSKLARILHDEGFEAGKRKFRLFTFSRILGDYEIKKTEGNIKFLSPFRLVVNSVMNEFIQELAEELLRRKSVRIASQRVSLSSAEVADSTIDRDKVKIKMLSPVTIYSTLSHPDGRKKTYYYSPFENEFSHLISENVRKKFKAYYKKAPPGDISLKPLKVNSGNQKIVSYKGTIIKGWTGIYELSGDHELMKIAYDTGLGGKNSQGFGCFEVI
jgi:CRISPR-associated endoribonuclease Cas6